MNAHTAKEDTLAAIEKLVCHIAHINLNSLKDKWPADETNFALTTAFDAMEKAVAEARALHLPPSAMECGGPATPLLNPAEVQDALQTLWAHYSDLIDSNPGLITRCVLQDYKQWNDALMKTSRVLAPLHFPHASAAN